jgi:nitroreductase
MKLLPEIRNRRSIIVFQERGVEQEKIDSLVEAARWAPSCFNKQEWNYVFVSKSDETRGLFEDALAFGNGWAKSAPYIAAVSANPDQACNRNNIPYYAYDLGLSVMSLVIEAEHLGLRVHQMAGYDETRVKTSLSLPDSQRVVVVFALGYEGDVEKIKDKVTEKIKDKITRSRTRKDPQENFFFGRFSG